MNVLITGASGFVGSALIRALHDKNVIVAQSRTQHPSGNEVRWIEHDLLNDSWEGRGLPEFDVVYHLAAQTSTYAAKADPLMDLQANVISFLRLLDYVRTQERRPFVVLTGTVTEVGLTDVLPIREDMIDRPITFYDVSKLSAELYLQQYVREGWVEGCTLRLANVYGGIRSGQQRDRGILDRIFAKASAGEAVTVFGDGDNLRDYVYIDDVVSALVAAPAHPRTTSGRTFNIGTGHGRSLKDAFTTVARLADSNARIEHVVPPAGLSPIESRNAIIDSSAFSAATGWKPAFTFDEGLRAAYGETVSRSTRTGAD